MSGTKKTKARLLEELAALREQLTQIEAAASQRKQAEKALRRKGEQLQALIENSLEDVAVLNSDGTVRYQSPSMGRVLGYEPADQTGSNAFDYIHPEDRQTAEQALKQVKENPGSPLHVELRAPHSDGTWHTVEVVLRNLLDDPSTSGILANFRDITERKLAEEARIRHAAALARAQELQHSRQRIVTVQESLRRDIAQQLHGTVQNRLIIILHKLADLEKKTSATEIAEELDDTRRKLAEVMEDQVRPISHRLYPSILRRGLAASLQSLGDQFETALEIETDLDEEIQKEERIEPKLIPEQVRLSAYRIAEEALTNAVKYARGSKVNITMKKLPEGWFRLSIKDSGPGFDTAGTDSGLGMLMMQDYAEMAGGNCTIRSMRGEGTEVTATLPLGEPDGEPPEKTTPWE
ncbi:MAG: PAS domain S-box protein [Dehalococcoidia bacterium]